MANFKFLETEYQLKKLKPKYNNFWYTGKIKGYWCIVTTNFYEKLCSIMIGAHKEDTHKSLIEILKDEPNLKKAKITTEDATVTISYKIPKIKFSFLLIFSSFFNSKSSDFFLHSESVR